MQGLGYVTIEQMLRSRNTGELLSVGPGNYKVHNLEESTCTIIMNQISIIVAKNTLFLLKCIHIEHDSSDSNNQRCAKII